MVATTANGMAKIVHQLCDERDRLRAELAFYVSKGQRADDEIARLLALPNWRTRAEKAEADAMRKFVQKVADSNDVNTVGWALEARTALASSPAGREG